jgi:hypothetical protein
LAVILHFWRKTSMISRLLLFLSIALLSGCGGPKVGPREAAAEFFQQCASGQSSAAYQSATKLFQLGRTEKYFDARVHDLGLHQVKSVEWSPAEPRTDTQRVRGVFQFNDKEPLTLQVTMAQENGQWRVLSAKREGGANDDVFAVLARSSDTEMERTMAFVDPVAKALPSERQLQQLVETTLMDFNKSVQKADFSEFFASVSDRWKYRGKDPRALSYSGTDPRRLQESDPTNTAQRLTIEALKSAFQPFVEAKIDLSPLKGKPMTLDEPARLTSDGVLTMGGHYKEFVFQGGFPPQPRRITFKMEYVFEGSSWKLFGVTINAQPPEAAAKR